jgi:fatty-acyl-CoA synthase
LTAASFTDAHFFRTGDLVRVDTAGHLHFHSRLKEIIKTGGINVSPLDVESVLEQHPCVSHAFVVGVPDAAQGEVTVAIVQCSPGRTVTAEEVQSFVKSRAAAFKVPVHVLFRQEGDLPLLASGKIAKRVLRDEVMAELHIATT